MDEAVCSALYVRGNKSRVEAFIKASMAFASSGTARRSFGATAVGPLYRLGISLFGTCV